jgi:hypothetical protein
MCESCDKLDVRIERYQRLTQSITDQLTIVRIRELIVQLQAQKAALHPDSKNI